MAMEKAYKMGWDFERDDMPSVAKNKAKLTPLVKNKAKQPPWVLLFDEMWGSVA